MPRYLSHAAFTGGKIYMVLEYAEYSIRDYLNSRDIENKLSFQEVLMQML
jgi:hypothetical protein